MPITVWRVSGRFFPPGDEQNSGSRLSNSDIALEVNDLIKKASVFGPNVRLVWDNQIIDIFDITLPEHVNNGSDRTQLSSVWTTNAHGLFNDGNNFDPSSINIYFVGNVQNTASTDPTTMITAGTRDPAGPGSLDAPAFILINDCGFRLDIGIDNRVDDGTPSFTPFLQMVRHTMSHEMCHFFARFRNRTFTSNGSTRTYNSSEHTGNSVDPLSLANNLLRDGPGFYLYPLVIPGNFEIAGNEKYEIYNRVISGNWINP